MPVKIRCNRRMTFEVKLLPDKLQSNKVWQHLTNIEEVINGLKSARALFAPPLPPPTSVVYLAFLCKLPQILRL